MQALQPLAATLRELRIRNAASLTQRSLLQLSVFRDLEVLELKHCGKISWCELQEAWRMACMAYEVHNAEAPAPATNSAIAASYSKASIFGGWLPGGGRVFRTSSPSSSTVLAALTKQKSGGGSTSGFLASLKGRGSGSRACQLGKGAVGNGRSSSGGGPTDIGPVRSFLQRKQKEQMATAASAPGELSLACADVAKGAENFEEQAGAAAPLISSSSDSLQQVTAAMAADALVSSQQQQMAEGKHWSIATSCDAAAATQQSTAALPSSTLYRVGSLVWQGTTAAAAAFSSGSIARQSSAVQTALLAYLADDGAVGGSSSLAAAGSLRWDQAQSVDSHCSVNAGSSGSRLAALQSGGSTTCRFAPNRRRPSGDKPLPSMPFTRLVSLSFTCSEVTYKRPGPEIAAIATLTTLTCLELGKCKLPDSVFWRLGSLTRLSKLKLTELWSMGDEGLAELAKLTNLKSLSLSEAMHVTAAGLQSLNKLTGLTALALGLTQDLGPSTVAKVASGFRGLSCLEVTASCWCDVDCELLAEAAADVSLLEAAASAAAAAAAQPPLMLWNVSRASSPTYGLSSRSNSNKLLLTAVPPLSASSSRSNSSMNLSARPASINSMASFGSFGSFSAVPVASSMVQQPLQPQQLLVLKLHGCCTLGHRGMAALKQLKHLQTLVLDNCKQVHAAEVISQDLLPPKLVSLSLKSMPFGNAFSGCVNMPRCASTLTKLELASLSAVHSGQLRRILNFFVHLQDLNMAGSLDIGDAAVQQIVLPKLLQLNLTNTRITNHGLEQLMHLPALKALCLRGCNLVTDAGLLVLEVYPALQDLDLSECTGVSERGVWAAMQGVRGLVSLNICGCKALTRGLLHGCPHYLHIKHTL